MGRVVSTVNSVRRQSPGDRSRRIVGTIRFKPANDMSDITTVIGGSARRTYDRVMDQTQLDREPRLMSEPEARGPDDL